MKQINFFKPDKIIVVTDKSDEELGTYVFCEKEDAIEHANQIFDTYVSDLSSNNLSDSEEEEFINRCQNWQAGIIPMHAFICEIDPWPEVSVTEQPLL